MAAIGIDLGTTNCCVAAVRANGVAEVIVNHLGKRTTPSAIAFYHNNPHYGVDAFKIYSKCPKSVICGLKYIIGGDIKKIKHNQNPIVSKNGRLSVLVTDENNKTRTFEVELLTALLLKHLKENAEARLDENVETAVITVPTYFKYSSRQATIDAAKIAGFKNVHLLNEPTAAAIAYGEKFVDKKTILVFDLGGGTFDISIMSVNREECSVLAMDGDLHMGGDNIDENLINYVKNKLPDLFTESVMKDKKKMHRLKRKCETAKKDLSTCAETSIELLEIGSDLCIDLSLQELNEINREFFDKCIRIMNSCLEKMHIEKKNIDAVLLVGGSTRNQEIKKLIIAHMGAEKLKEDTNADEVVAIGAAIMAANKIRPLRPTKVSQLSAYSLGISIEPDHTFKCLIPKFSKFPLKASDIFDTTPPENPSSKVSVYAGECTKAKENALLATVLIEGVHKNSDGFRKFTLTFELDDNGTLQVCADDRNGAIQHASIMLDKGNFSNKKIQEFSNKIQNMQLLLSENK